MTTTQTVLTADNTQARFHGEILHHINVTFTFTTKPAHNKQITKTNLTETKLTDIATQWQRHADEALTKKQNNYWDGMSSKWMNEQDDNVTGRKWNEDYTYFESEKDYQCHYIHEQSDEDVTMGIVTTDNNSSTEDQHDIYMDPMEIEYLGNLFGVKELTGDVVLKCFTVNDLLDQLESTTLKEAVLDVQGIARQIATKSQNELLDMIEQTSEPGQIDCGEIAKVSGTGVRNVQKKVKMLKEKFDKKFSDWL